MTVVVVVAVLMIMSMERKSFEIFNGSYPFFDIVLMYAFYFCSFLFFNLSVNTSEVNIVVAAFTSDAALCFSQVLPPIVNVYTTSTYRYVDVHIHTHARMYIL